MHVYKSTYRKTHKCLDDSQPLREKEISIFEALGRSMTASSLKNNEPRYPPQQPHFSSLFFLLSAGQFRQHRTLDASSSSAPYKNSWCYVAFLHGATSVTSQVQKGEMKDLILEVIEMQQ